MKNVEVVERIVADYGDAKIIYDQEGNCYFVIPYFDYKVMVKPCDSIKVKTTIRNVFMNEICLKKLSQDRQNCRETQKEEFNVVARTGKRSICIVFDRNGKLSRVQALQFS